MSIDTSKLFKSNFIIIGNGVVVRDDTNLPLIQTPLKFQKPAMKQIISHDNFDFIDDLKPVLHNEKIGLKRIKNMVVVNVSDEKFMEWIKMNAAILRDPTTGKPFIIATNNIQEFKCDFDK